MSILCRRGGGAADAGLHVGVLAGLSVRGVCGVSVGCLWGVCGVSVGCLDGRTPRIRQADAPAHGGAMSSIGIATSRSGVFLKQIEGIRRNLLIYKNINIYAQKLWITL